MECDRDAARVEQRVVERAQRERRSEAQPLVRAQPEQQDLAEQVGEVVRRRARVPVDLGGRVRSLEAGVLDEGLDGLADADLAPMEPDVEDDPCGAPDRVGRDDDPPLGGVLEALLEHQLLAVHAPALHELGRAREQPRGRRGTERGRVLLVVPRVRLVDARVHDRRPAVLPHRARVAVDRRRDEVEAAQGPIVDGRLDVRGEGHDAAQVGRRRDDLEELVVRDRRDAPPFDEVPGALGR